METGAVKSSWLDSKWVAFTSGVAGLATVVAVVFVGLAWSDRVPPDSALAAVAGDVVVMEGNYAHLMTDSGPLKITYGCACATGWQAWMRESERVEARVKRVNAGRAEAHHVVVDGHVLVDIDRARAHYQRKLALSVGLALLCVPLLALRWAHRRHQRRGGKAIHAQRLEVLRDDKMPWASRLQALEAVVGSREPEVSWTLRELCMRNTESVEALEAFGTGLARHVQAVGDDDALYEEVIYLQIPARQALDAAMDEAGRGDGAEPGSLRAQVDAS